LTSVNILRVPGSSANLGPGFDSLGVALQIYLECRFSPSSRLAIRVKGRDAELISSREDNLIWQTALAVAARAHMTLPPINLDIINDIPIGKGLGSSAAALTAGVVIAEKLLDLRWKAARRPSRQCVRLCIGFHRRERRRTRRDDPRHPH
jgi:homoserine kinase